MIHIDFKIVKKHFPLFVGFAGCFLIVVGVIFNPEFVGKYIMKKELLDRRFVMKDHSYQLIAVTIGFAMVILSVFLLNKKHTKLIVAFITFIFLTTAYNVYVKEIYPNNILLKPSEIGKLGHVILGTEILLSNFQPTSNLVVKNRRVMKAKYAAIDFHFHLASLKEMNAEELVLSMDKCGIEKIVNVDGDAYWADAADIYMNNFKYKYPNRFVMFTQVDLRGINRYTSVKEQVDLLEKKIGTGAQGLKVWKDFGLGIRDKSGRFVSVDDVRYDPIWAKAGELGIPVLMHTADPTAFFYPTDRFNERFEELSMFPDWSYYGPEFPKKETIMIERENLLRRHPKTVFVGAHVGCSPENLEYAGYLLDKYPNFYVDFGAMLSDLGRQPFSARKFFIAYQDRILFGSDGGYALGTKEWPAEKFYSTYFEFLETSNEYFGYPLWDIQKQGRWQIYGVNLPDEVLEKIYNRNAKKILAMRRK